MNTKLIRQEKISQLIRAGAAATQQELAAKLEAVGIQTTQSTLSRDLSDLGVYKANGIYQLPHIEPGTSSLVDLLDLDTAGDSLIVLRTAPGQADIVAIAIDHTRIPEVVGTVAGDDTIFVAVKGAVEQRRAIRSIWALFKERGGNNGA